MSDAEKLRTVEENAIPECTGKPLGDIGHDISAELRYVGGELDGVEYKHQCSATPISRPFAYLPVKPAWRDGWDVVSVEPLTLSPSILCTACKHHGYIRDGRWVPA